MTASSFYLHKSYSVSLVPVHVFLLVIQQAAAPCHLRADYPLILESLPRIDVGRMSACIELSLFQFLFVVLIKIIYIVYTGKLYLVNARFCFGTE